ncbi:MAG TPA: hypothetical protein VGM64_03175 [Lacunisphaera sp.]|jgi:hypothetical protein
MKIWILSIILLTVNASATTYYIDFASGSDTNNGISKSTPWKHHPDMAGSTVKGFAHSAGDQYIFKGGVTWDPTCWPMTLSAGGSSSANDYYGVDQTWYTGGSWRRPVFDRSYTAASTDLLSFGSANYITVDSIELEHLNTTNAYGVWLINGAGGGVKSTIKNCYIHGWRTTAANDDAHGGVGGMPYAPFSTTLTLDNTEIENSENGGSNANGVCVRAVGIIQNGCKIHDNSSAVLFCLDFNGSYLYNISGAGFDSTYHFNGIYIDPVSMGQKQGYIRNSFLHDTAGGANMAYINVRGGATITMYDNVLYGTMSAQGGVEIEPFQYGGEGVGNLLAYNNTICNYSSSAAAFHVVTRTGQPVGVLSLYNNHVINAGSVTDAKAGVNANTFNSASNLLQSASTATSQGYTLSNLYAPTSTSSSTYNAGTNIAGLINLDILGLTRTQWDIGAYTFNSGSVAATPPSNAKISIAVP